MWLLIVLPPLLIIAALIIHRINNGELGIVKYIIFSAFLSIAVTLTTAITLFLKKRIGVALTTFSCIVSLVYTALPATLLAKRIEAEGTAAVARPMQQRNLLRTLLFSEPHYKMEEEKIVSLINSVRNLKLGEYYIAVFQKLPPVPENCPIIMRTLETNEVVLIYFIRKKSEGSEISSGDKHISLYFDSKMNLKLIDEVI